MWVLCLRVVLVAHHVAFCTLATLFNFGFVWPEHFLSKCSCEANCTSYGFLSTMAVFLPTFLRNLWSAQLILVLSCCFDVASPFQMMDCSERCSKLGILFSNLTPQSSLGPLITQTMITLWNLLRFARSFHQDSHHYPEHSPLSLSPVLISEWKHASSSCTALASLLKTKKLMLKRLMIKRMKHLS